MVDTGAPFLNDLFRIRRSHSNVQLITQHMAFYYENAIRDMVYNSLYGMKMLADGKEIPYRLA